MSKIKGKVGTSSKFSPINEKIDKTSDAMANFRSTVIKHMFAQEQVDNLIHPQSVVQKIRSRFIERHVQLESGKREADYSVEDLAFALSMYRNCGHLPPIWTSFLVVPSKSVMAGLLMEMIPTKPGFDPVLFEVIKSEARNLASNERLCMLLFDEIVLCPNLWIEEGHDSVLGFEDFGYRRGKDIATHAQVFMLSGLKLNWTYPAFYSFSHGPANAADIKKIIKIIVERCGTIGLKVIATVCDHKPNNVEAINDLLRTSKESRLKAGYHHMPDTTFAIAGQEIAPVYDVKKIFSGIRNNFLKSEIHFIEKDEEKVGKWEHIKQIYETKSPLLSEKLADKHVYPEKIDKKDVVTSLQVFSYKVAAALNLYATHSKQSAQPAITLDAVHTATLVHFLDQLFDSLNGREKNFEADESKPLRSPATVKTHFKFWKGAVSKLESFKFKKNGVFYKSPALKCLILTIKNFVLLTSEIEKVHIPTLNQQKLTLEKLEKFMKTVTRKRNSTAERFITHYHFNRVHSFLGGNPVCKRYGSLEETGVFNTLQKILLKELDEEPQEDVKFTKIPGLELFGVQDYPLDRKLVATLSEFVAASCTNKCKKLVLERNIPITNDPADNRFVKTFKVNLQFSDQIRNACTLIKFILGKDLHKRGVFRHVTDYVSNEIQFTDCEHAVEITRIILDNLVKMIAEKYIGQINDVLKGKYLKNLPSNSSTYVKRAAQMSEKYYGKKLAA